jgi:uncharacterized protein (DUF2141 family)
MVLLVALLLSNTPAPLRVILTGVDAARGGTITCALFDAPAGFPMDSSKSRLFVKARQQNGAWSCEFAAPAGVYAVSVAHDANDNGKVDTNLFGVPTEAWGTSRDVVPLLRAPTFDESKVTLSSEAPLSIKVHP